jgi:uroporphyrinogen decarboxylase
MRMTSNERLLTALAHREPDRIPFDLGGTLVSGINIHALRRLKPLLGLTEEPQVQDRVTQMAETGDDVRERLGVDVKSVRPRAASGPSLARDLGVTDGYDRLVDEFGMGWQMPHDGHYYDLYQSPLALPRRSRISSTRGRSTAGAWRTPRNSNASGARI